VERAEEEVTYLDTHVVAWLYGGELEKLSATAAEEIQKNDSLISPMVVLELQYLFEIGRATSPASTVIEALKRRIGLSVCELSFAKVVEGALHQKWGRDPFDRLIVAHASANDAPLITKDEKIRRHYKRAVW
jgi:PIN domain nuclease of toxin-antitoxin system